MRKSSRTFFWGILICILLLGVGGANAEPAPDKLVVNHELLACATIFGGDECMDCLPPEGWEVLGWAYQAECPAGYTMTTVEYECQPFKTIFCCTEGHSGAAGDCEDLVINRIRRQCAFIEEISACNLPLGWQARPAEIEPYNWACPYSEQNWVSDLDCGGQAVASDGDESPASKQLPLPCISGWLLPIALLGITFWRRSYPFDRQFVTYPPAEH